MPAPKITGRTLADLAIYAEGRLPPHSRGFGRRIVTLKDAGFLGWNASEGRYRITTAGLAFLRERHGFTPKQTEPETCQFIGPCDGLYCPTTRCADGSGGPAAPQEDA